MAKVVTKASGLMLILVTMAPALVWAAPPTARDDLYVDPEDSIVSEDVLDNDFDSDGDPISVISNTNPASGVVVVAPNGAMTYTPDPGFSGEDTFDYEIFGQNLLGCLVPGPGCVDTATVRLLIRAVADAPATFNLPAAAGDEDTSVPLVIDLVPGDPDGSETLEITIRNVPANATLSNGNPLGGGTWRLTPADLGGLQFIPDPNQHPNAALDVEVVVQDEARDASNNLINSDSDSFSGVLNVTVNPVNDPPFVANPAPDLNLAEDGSGSVSLAGVFDDVDIATSGDSLTLSVDSLAGDPVIDTAVMVGNSLNVTLLPDVNGSATVTVLADDGDATVTTDVTVNVAAQNDQPVVVAALAPIIVDEDAANAMVDVSGAFDDVDILNGGDSLAYSVEGIIGDAVIDTATVLGNQLELAFLTDQNGNATVTVRATDDAGAFVETTVDVTVNPVNDAPFVAALIPDVNLSEEGNTTVDLSGTFDDVDIATNGDVLALSVDGVIGDPVIDGLNLVGASLDITLLPNAHGNATITIRAEDGTDFVTTTLDLIVGAVNDPPVVVGALAPVVVDEDSGGISVDVSASFDDVDIATSGDNLTYSVAATAGDPVLAPVNFAGSQLNLSFLPDQNGATTLTIRATDDAGAFTDTPIDITVNPVNDAPFVNNPIADITLNEDSLNTTINLDAVFDDVDILTNGDVLVYQVLSNTNPALFDTAGIGVGAASPNELALVSAPDANGNATLVIQASDGALTVTDTFVVSLTSVNDMPAAADDVAAMNEDDPAITIDVLANDYLAEQPTIISVAGVGGSSESPPTTIFDLNGDPQIGPNGSVAIVGNQIEYTPKPNFHGVDFFTYTIEDADGDTSSATVTVTVAAQNDAPTGTPLRTFIMSENDILTVPANLGLTDGAYDVDSQFVDQGGNQVADPLSAFPTTFPLVGVLNFDNPTGTFSYEPPVNFTGEVNFTYRLFDGSDPSPTDYDVRIVVNPVAPPAPPPPAGEVAWIFNLANAPLEQSSSVQPNVLVMMDDSGSMDWNQSIQGDDPNGTFRMDNDPIATSNERAYSYTYLWDLPDNTYPENSTNGLRLPTEDALDGNVNTDNNQYGVWRGRTVLHNTLYYNPEVQYRPWKGQDSLNQPFGNADPANVRLDPIDPTNTFDILALHSYWSFVPDWDNNGGARWLWVDNVYIPHYYTTPAAPPLAWDDPRTRILIQPGDGPLPGDRWPGGPGRNDCRVGDDDPLDCTYAQEIQNFANWFQYYRKREYVAKGGISSVIADAQDIRVGYETLNFRASEDVIPLNDIYTEGNKKTILDAIFSVNSNGGTPLRQALERAGEIFRCNGAGACPVLPAPEGTCQQNFTLLFSDGYWNGAAGVPNNRDIDGPGPWDGGRYADNRSDTLADTAMYYYETDLQPGLDDRVPPSSRDLNGAPVGTFAPDTLMHQHMKTFTIAFGVLGNVDPSTVPADPTTPFAWPSPTATPQGRIDDMLHAAVNGRGRFLSAVNPQALQNAIEAAFLEFSKAESSTSAAAFNSTSLQEDTLLFRGFYDLRNNTGELTATEVNDDGTLAAVATWKASEQLDPVNKLPNERRLVTFDRTNNLGLNFLHGDLTPDMQIGISPEQVNFIRGDRGEEFPGGPLRQRPATGGLLGDIVNSSPVFVGTPRAINRDQAPYPITDLYSDFVDDKRNRQPVVYVGANDGILHGFDATSGEEMFGFVPSKILDSSTNFANRLADFTSPFYQHQYYVDLTPRLNDVYMRASRTAPSRSWNTVLLGGLGAGGKGYFALNVTDPGSQYATANGARNSVLWEFTDDDDTYPVDSAGTPLGGFIGAITDPNGNPVKDLGYALSLPVISMSNAHEAGPGSDKEWIAIFGNGPNSTSGMAKLFVLFMDRGLDGWAPGDYVKIDTERGVPVAPAQWAGYPNGLGSPAAVDADLNGTTDFVYAGDRFGNLYRFDLRDSNPDNWDYTLLFTATYDDGGVDRVQPILSQPLVVKHPTEEGFLVIFGTGSFIAKEDGSDQEIQSIYGIWDRGEANPPTAQADTKDLRLIEQEITNVVDDSAVPAQTRRIVSRNPVTYTPESGVPGTYGWYIDLDMERASNTLSGGINADASGNAPPAAQFPGEKAIRRFLFRDGNVVTTTILPTTGEASCFGARPGSILLFDALTGGDAVNPVIDFNVDGEIDEDDLVDVGGDEYAAGLLFNQDDLDGSLVDLSSLGGADGTDFLFVSGGNTTIGLRWKDEQDNRTGRLSWREMTDLP